MWHITVNLCDINRKFLLVKLKMRNTVLIAQQPQQHQFAASAPNALHTPQTEHTHISLLGLVGVFFRFFFFSSFSLHFIDGRVEKMKSAKKKLKTKNKTKKKNNNSVNKEQDLDTPTAFSGKRFGCIRCCEKAIVKIWLAVTHLVSIVRSHTRTNGAQERNSEIIAKGNRVTDEHIHNRLTNRHYRTVVIGVASSHSCAHSHCHIQIKYHQMIHLTASLSAVLAPDAIVPLHFDVTCIFCDASSYFLCAPFPLDGAAIFIASSFELV